MIKKINLFDALFSLFIFFSILSERTLLGRSSMFLFILYSFYKLLQYRINIKTKYFVLEILFILFAVAQLTFSITTNKSDTVSMISTLIISLLLYIAIFIYYKIVNNNEKFLKTLFYTIQLSVFTNIIIEILFKMFGFTNNYINIFDIQIGGAISISIGLLTGILLILSNIIFKNKPKFFWINFIILSIIIFYVNDRKSILFIFISLITWFFGRNRKIKLLYVSMFIIVSSFFILGFSYLYLGEKIPKEVMNIYNYFFGNRDNINDSSINTRIRLIEYAKAAFKSKPVLGWGLNTFKSSVSFTDYYAHNNFYEILVGVGIIGFLIYYLKYIHVLRELSIRRKLNKNKSARYEYSVIIILLFTLIVIEYWQVTYFTRKFMIFWIVGLLYKPKIVKEIDNCENYVYST